MREAETQREREERESQAGSTSSTGPVAGFHPMTLASWPEMKSRVGRLTHWATQVNRFYYFFKVISVPYVRLELTTPRSRVACCIDWALQDPLFFDWGFWWVWGTVSSWSWFAFPWRWVMLSIFSCTPGPFVWFQRNVHSYFLPILELVVWFVFSLEFNEFSIYSGY